MEFIDINANLTGVESGSVATGDYDGDGDLDLLITGWDSSFNPITKIYENDGSGGFSENTSANLEGVALGSVATGDYDGDGDLDLLITGWDSDRNSITKIYENDGSGGFSEDTSANLQGVSRSSVAWGDYDGDGDLDLLITGVDSSYNRIAKIYENDGSGGFSEDTDVNLTDVAGGLAAWGDYDGDGDLDLLITGRDSDRNRSTKLYENDGSGGFSENTSANLTDAPGGLASWGDYDGDGDLDLLIISDSTFAPLTKLYENDGSGGFSEDTDANLTDVGAGSVAWEDYDGDGDLDLLITGAASGFTAVSKLYENDGSGGFSEDTDANLTDVVSGASVAWEDYDGDGDPDLLITGRDGDRNPSATIYQNNSVPAFDNSGRDQLDGTDAAEILDGGENNDTLNGSLGADDLIGGGGRDRAIYRNSAAAVTVDLSTNTASGGDAEGDTFDSIESVDGSNFDDALTGDDNENRLYGRNGDDTLIDNAGDDYLSGQGGADSLTAGAGLDRLLGGSGNDTLAGEADSDMLAGGMGDDSLTGASTTTNGVGEIDRMQGNAGADIFVLGTTTTAFYDDGDNSSNGLGDYGLIFGFDVAEDVIELSSSQTYYLDENPLGTVSGTGIFIDDDGTAGFSSNDELVGLLQDVSLAAGEITGATTGFDLVVS